MNSILTKARAMAFFKKLTLTGGRELTESQLNDFKQMIVELNEARSIEGIDINDIEKYISELS
jgi:hypothetical protein